MKLRKIKPVEVTYHHSLSKDVSASTIRLWHLEKGWPDIGYHFVIRANGSIEFGRDLKYIGAHAYGKNGKTIGVCFTGNFKKNEPTAAQLESAKGLHLLLELVHGPLKVGFHRKFQNPCPGKLFSRQKLIRMIKG